MKPTQIKIEDFQHFKSIDLPDGFIEQWEDTAYSGARWCRNFAHSSIEGMRIALFYRGFRTGPQDAEVLRALLSEVPLLIYDERTNFGDENLVRLLSEVMGNLGDNQIVNTEDAAFHIEKLQARLLNERPVLDCEGYFVDEDGDCVNMVHSIQFDGTPNSDLSEIHEVIFEAPSVETYLEFHPAFEDFLVSIQWQS